MGNSESVDIPGGGSEGYHILRVQENSPGSKAGLQPFFDFIVSINGIRLDRDNDTLKTILKNGIGKQIPMTVYSYKSQSVRTLTIEPSDTWGGQGHLGVSIKFCSFEVAKETVWHILEVHPNSPAAIAKLRPFTDYIVGSDSVLHESEDLYNLIESHDGVPLKFYVYNSDDDTCREVTITPNSQWGGEGMLGCGIGYGYLHRIPVRNVVQPPPTTTIFSQVPTISPPSDKQSEIPSNATTESINTLIQNTENLKIQPCQLAEESQLATTSNSTVQQNAPVYTSNVPAPSSIPNFNINFQTVAPTSNDMSNSNIQNTATSQPQVSLYSPQPIVTPAMYNPADYSVNNINPTVYPVYSYPLEQSSNVQTNVHPPMQTNYPQTYILPQAQPSNKLYGTPASNSTLPPPPLSGFQNQPIIFDPHIAAQSAQQLLSGAAAPSSKSGPEIM
ncbi:Golgi reassembly-stacking protein 2 [Diorhabda sublineata]|uniref:Golgi reassembly-stacking protein 2 n=1 Tax=Diorhabda sublineata TaxID=1163346 RepID=UPI0024E14C54|nr:Golgi reassembly-stacking protein 2 [Diorhabda sublineata]